tara:strand:+ start:1173 stop:1364 length:192 start_codon:yes stop_codon:yes gene_type:complete
MTKQEIAQAIAVKIDTHSQKEIEAMMKIVCEVNDIEMSWLFPVVSNIYAKLNPSVMKSHVAHY